MFTERVTRPHMVEDDGRVSSEFPTAWVTRWHRYMSIVDILVVSRVGTSVGSRTSIHATCGQFSRPSRRHAQCYHVTRVTAHNTYNNAYFSLSHATDISPFEKS